MDSRADLLVKRQAELEGQRGTWDAQCQEIAERIWPARANFTRRNITSGEKRTEKMFDPTGAVALTRFAAADESMIAPRTSRWHTLRVDDEELGKLQPVREYLDAVTALLFRVRYSARANFAGQLHEALMSVGAFGPGGMMVDDNIGIGIRYKSLDMARTWFAEDHNGVVDTVHRSLEYTGRQAVQKFGEKRLPKQILQAAEKGSEQLFEFLHCIQPNAERQPLMRNQRGMEYSSYYVCRETRDIVGEGGYRTFPCAITRYITVPGDVQGSSPAQLALPEIKMLNEVRKTDLKARHRALMPPLLLQEDGALQAFDLRPDALNFGGVDERGQPLVHALQYQGRLEVGTDTLEQSRRMINDAFLVTLFQVLVDRPNITATEALLRAQEKGALLGPTMGRQQGELLGVIVARELDILAHAGQLPPMPPELIEAGGLVEIEYTSPLNRAQRAEDGIAIMRTAESVATIAQFEPQVVKTYDWIKAARELGDINGMPEKLKRSDDEIADMHEAEDQLAAMQQLTEAAPLAAGAAKSFAQAQALAAQGKPADMPL